MNTPFTDREEERAQDLLVRARRFQVLAAALSYPETGHHGAVRKDLLQLVGLGDGEGIRETALTELAAAWITCDPDELRAEHGRLFLGQTPCPLHEAAYSSARNLAGPAADIADISGFYHAFAMDIREETPERPDLLTVELEFYSSLLAREAYALVNGWQDALEITNDAARVFLEDHLGRWRGVLTERLARHDAKAPLPELAAWLDALLEAEVRDRDVNPQPFGEPVNDPMQADAIVCPHARDASRL